MRTPLLRRAGRTTALARAGTVAATVLALVLALPGTATAAPGDLDPAFSGDGKTITAFADDDQAHDVAVQSDGKIVTVGSSADYSLLESRWALTRHNADGSLDTGFGDGGRVTTPINNRQPDLQWGEASAVALQSDGKIVVAGHAWRGWEDCCWFTVARYNSDGSLDTGFGDDGRVLADIAGPTEARDVAVDSAGRIVAAGYTGGEVALLHLQPDGTPDSSFGGDVGTTRFDFSLMRFLTNGSLDTSFDGDGMVRTDFGDYETVHGLAVQADGKIVAAGGDTMARYLANGALDTGFDGDGKVTVTGGVAWDLALQPSDGRILLAGNNPGNDLAVLRYTTDGAKDTGFGASGIALADFGGNESARTLAVQSDGKIVAGGGGGAPPPGGGAAGPRPGGPPPPPPPPPPHA
ncbi:calcium-binding protein, partial [Streptomyces sp. NPDC054829]